MSASSGKSIKSEPYFGDTDLERDECVDLFTELLGGQHPLAAVLAAGLLWCRLLAWVKKT